MKKLIILSLITLNFFQSKAQLLFDYAYHPLTSEVPLGFVKFNSFKLLLSCSKLYPTSGGGSGLRVVGINNDKSIRFNKLLPTFSFGGPTLGSHTFDRITTYAPTHDKGMLIAVQGQMCSTGTHTIYNTCLYTKVDSLGSVVFNTITINSTGGTGEVSSTFYYINDYNKLHLINPTNGVIIYPAFITFSNSITATAVDQKKQIIISTFNSLDIIDTTVTSVINKQVTGNYSKIIPNNKRYYLLNTNSTLLEVRDSLLNLLSSISSNTSNAITNYSIHDDSVYVAFHNTLSDQSSIGVYTWSLSAISISTINNTHQKIIAIEKSSEFDLLICEHVGNLNFGQYPYGISSYNHVENNNTGFATFQQLTNIQYPSDIVLKQIKNISFAVTDTASYLNYNINACYYKFQNNLIIYNNSLDTIKSFHVNLPHFGFYVPSASYCYVYPNTTTFDGNYTLTINPHDSIEIQLPQMTDKVPYPKGQTYLNVEICYGVSLPNNRIDNQLNNNTSCLQFSVSLLPAPPAPAAPTNSLINLFYSESIKLSPVPTDDRITIFSPLPVNSYVITDTYGKLIMSGSNTNKIYTSALSAGVYFMTISTSEETVTKKFIKR